MYEIELDWSPANEFLVSLQAFMGKDTKTLELGETWARTLRRQIGHAFSDDGEPTHRQWLDVLAVLCPGDRQIDSFLGWVEGLSAGTLYELLLPWTDDSCPPIPADLGLFLEWCRRVLPIWNSAYFAGVDTAILAGLEANAVATRALIGTMEPVDLIELVTSGVRFSAPPGIATVRLIPQYHYRPWNIHGNLRGLRLYFYPADVLPVAAGDPSPALLRLTRALADENRLRILRFLAAGPRSFTEVARFSGLAKSTTHYHMVALRAAGLVRVHDSGEGPASYSLRPTATQDLEVRLQDFLGR